MRAHPAVGTDRRRGLGIAGEDLACTELRRRGYAILERGYRTRFGEIDVVARHRGELVFVEVKARTTGRCGDGAEAVSPYKQWRVARMAAEYLVRRGLHDRPCRFDVVAVDLGVEPPRVEVYEGAFDAPFG